MLGEFKPKGPQGRHPHSVRMFGSFSARKEFRLVRVFGSKRKDSRSVRIFGYVRIFGSFVTSFP